MADKVVQLKNKDGDNLYPVSVLPGERILWEDTLEVAPEHSEGVNDMVGATASSAGVHGLVPAPVAGDQDKVLKGDGTWASATFDDMTGATASAAGVRGLAPQPAAGDQNKALAGDGTWKEFVTYDVTSGSSIDIGDLYANVGANHNYVLGGTAVSADDCIWTPKHLDETISAGRLVEERVFAYASMTDPITNTVRYGECKTTIYYNFSKYHVIQEFTVFQDSTQANIIKFRRKWYTTANASTPSAASWTKLAWIPIEYPKTTLPDGWLVTTGFSYHAEKYFTITGGIMDISFNEIKTTSNISGYTKFMTLPVKVKETGYMYFIMYDLDGTIGSIRSLGSGNNEFGVQKSTANKTYRLNMCVPLGY